MWLSQDYLSRSNNLSDQETDSWNVRTTALWRHRLTKPGRTFSMMVNGGASGSDSKTKTVKDIYTGGMSFLNNQLDKNDNNNSSIGGNLQWTEPLATGLNLSLRYDINYNRSKRETTIDMYKDENFTNFLEHDKNNSNTYEQKNLRNSGEIGLSYNYQKLRINATARFQHSNLKGEQNYFLLDANDANNSSFSTSKNYVSILPNVRIEYTTKGGTQFRINYRSNSNNPSISNLQESVNTTDPLRYSTGNSQLDQSISHNLNFNMIYTNTETAQNFMIFGGFNATQDQISNQTLENKTTSPLEFGKLNQASLILLGILDENAKMKNLSLASGGSFSRPVNRDGSKSVFLNFGYGFPFDFIMSNVNISVGGNYGINPSNQLYFLDATLDDNGKYKNGITSVESKTRTFGLSPRLHISSNISSDLNFNFFYAPQFQWVDDTKADTQNRDFINHNLNASLNWSFWNGFTTDQSLGYSRFGGPSQPEAIEQWVWNAAIGKKFLKGNKAEIKLQAFDILGSNKGFSRNVGDNSISSSYRNFMPRYFLCTFTYKITAYKAGGKRATQTEEAGFGGPGGFPGGGRGFGGPGRF